MTIRKNVVAGQRLRVTAEEYNAFLQLANNARNTHTIGVPNGTPGNISKSLIRVKNASGAAVDRFQPLEITTPVFLPSDNEEEFKNLICVNGDTPDEDSIAICVPVEPIAAGSIGQALAPGLTQCQVEINSDDDDYVKISSTGTFESGPSGIGLIVWKAGSTGTQWALIQIGGTATQSSATSAEEISCLVNDATGVAPGDSTITVDNVAAVWPVGATAPSVTSVNNILKWRIHDDNHPIWARKNAAGTWDAIRREPVPYRITFAVNDAGGVADTDTTITVDTVAAIGEPGASAPTVTTVYIEPVSGATASDDAPGRAEWNEATDHWECYWLEYDCGA